MLPARPECIRALRGGGGLTSLIFLWAREKPKLTILILLYAEADDKPRDTAAKPSKIYIIELSAAKATVFQLRGEQWGCNAI